MLPWLISMRDKTRMRFMRTVGGALLLTIGIPVLLAGGALWTVAGHRDPGGAFAGSLERLETSGYAVVVPDLNAMLRRDAPFLRAGDSRLRITAQTGEGPAFLGIAPATDVARYLAAAPHATLDRVSVTRGPLPVRLAPAMPSGTGTGPALPGSGAGLAPPDTQTFWRHSAAGVLDLPARNLRQRSLSLVLMRPDGAAGIGAQARVEVRAGWLDPAMWGLLAAGVVLVFLAAVALTWPVRPREIVFVVEPAQVPVLAARLGVATLDPAANPLGVTADRPGSVPSGLPAPRPERRFAVRPANLAEMRGAEHRPAPVPAAGTLTAAAPVPAVAGMSTATDATEGAPVVASPTTAAAPSTWPPGGRPAPPPYWRLTWPPSPPDWSSPGSAARPSTASQPDWPPSDWPPSDWPPSDWSPFDWPQLDEPEPAGPQSGWPPPAPPPVRSLRTWTAEFRSRSTAAVRSPARPTPGRVRLRPSVPIDAGGPGGETSATGGGAGPTDATASPTSATAGLTGAATSATGVGAADGPVGGRKGWARPASGRHHAGSPVVPVRSGVTPPAVIRRNMGHGRWWHWNAWRRNLWRRNAWRRNRSSGEPARPG